MIRNDTASVLDLRPSVRPPIGAGHDTGTGETGPPAIDLGDASADVLDAAFRIVRDHRPGKSDDPTLIDYWIPVSGSLELHQHDHGVSVGPDQLGTVIRRNAYRLETKGPARLVRISIPYTKLDIVPCAIETMAARRIDGRSTGATALLLQIATFTEFIADLRPGTAVRYGYHLVEMTSILTQEMFAYCQTDQDQVRAETLHRMQDWARERLGDPNLSTAGIARAHNVSVRYVQKLFKEHGESPNRWLRNERLTRCHLELRSPRNREATIAMIARRWGFYNCSYFTRVFRERYGVTPAACRPA
ncbi:helix-turn-helix transcriptional regulator [Glycomyces xiaoerkulensis]|uniref:helix-turn-helix transcriptional regulator n=1 Tax=Glycomyces xiaoerkulensis TaxID=2038139 RepID=UPI000C25AFB3|nr:helix-turn-helix transcriptional regulator [Glycomyces xiaoerkulensis]